MISAHAGVFLCVISGLPKNPKHKKWEESFTIIKIKLLKINGKETILKVARTIGTYCIKIKMTADFLLETMKMRSQWN